MVHIKVKKGLDIPINGNPEKNSGAISLPSPAQIGVDLTPFEGIKFRLLVKQGDSVKKGTPLIEEKDVANRLIVSPAAGVIKEIRRGEKRVLTTIVIEIAKQEEQVELQRLNYSTASKEEIVKLLLMGGVFAFIRSRPFNLWANPEKEPRSIFVKAVETAPMTPPQELQIAGHEKEFQEGLNILKKLTNGSVHLVYAKESSCKAFM